MWGLVSYMHTSVRNNLCERMFSSVLSRPGQNYSGPAWGAVWVKLLNGPLVLSSEVPDEVLSRFEGHCWGFTVWGLKAAVPTYSNVWKLWKTAANKNCCSCVSVLQTVTQQQTMVLLIKLKSCPFTEHEGFVVPPQKNAHTNTYKIYVNTKKLTIKTDLKFHCSVCWDSLCDCKGR